MIDTAPNTAQRFTGTVDAARYYAGRGFAIVPIPPGQKAPIAYGWQSKRFQPADFSPASNIGLSLGASSGGLVDIDLDAADARELADEFLPPTDAVTGRASATRSHRWYIAKGAVTKKFADPTNRKMIVELRSTGCQTVVGPSIHPSGEQYETLAEIPTEIDAAYLLECVENLWRAVLARRGIEPPKPVEPQPPPAVSAAPHPTTGNREAPIDIEYRAMIYLDAMPAAISGQNGHAATYAAATALVHGFGLDPECAFQLLWLRYNPRCCPPWSERELRHKINSAATQAHSRPYGWLRDEHLPGYVEPVEADDVDISGLMPSAPKVLARPSGNDPGVIPPELLHAPGFISDVMDLTLSTAPYPNRALAFAGAVSLQAFLAGRKVRDESDLRTNFYLLALAHSGSGKDWPRKVNGAVIERVGLTKHLGDSFASGEGLQDAIVQHGNMLFQTDEIDALITAIAKGREPRYGVIMQVLLTLFSSAASTVKGRVRSGQEPPSISQPCLNVLGTAVPPHYYAALRGAMLSNGFLARTITIDAGSRGKGQPARIIEPSPQIIEVANYWAEAKAGKGNLSDSNPEPRTVEATAEALKLIETGRALADKEYARCEAAGDDVGASVWARVLEHSHKLALVYAISKAPVAPSIDAAAIRWALQLAEHQARRLLWSVDNYGNSIADAPDECQAVLRRIRGAGQIAHSVLLKNSHMKTKDLEQIIRTLIEREEIEVVMVTTNSKPIRAYRGA